MISSLPRIARFRLQLPTISKLPASLLQHDIEQCDPETGGESVFPLFATTSDLLWLLENTLGGTRFFGLRAESEGKAPSVWRSSAHGEEAGACSSNA